MKWAFYLGAAVFIASVAWTVARTKEYSPAELAEFSESDVAQKAEQPGKSRSARQWLASGMLWLLGGIFFSGAVALFDWGRQLHVLGGGSAAFGVLQLVVAWLQSRGRTKDALYCIMDDLFHMPRTMRQLALVQFLSWFGLFAMWIYTTSAVTSRHYHATTGFCGLQRRRELGRRAVAAQRLRCTRRDPDPARRREDRAPPRAPAESHARRGG